MECDRFEWIFKHDLWSGSGSPKRPPRCIETTKSAHWNALSRPEKSRIQNHTVVDHQLKPIEGVRVISKTWSTTVAEWYKVPKHFLSCQRWEVVQTWLLPTRKIYHHWELHWENEVSPLKCTFTPWKVKNSKPYHRNTSPSDEHTMVVYWKHADLLIYR